MTYLLPFKRFLVLYPPYLLLLYVPLLCHVRLISVLVINMAVNCPWGGGGLLTWGAAYSNMPKRTYYSHRDRLCEGGGYQIGHGGPPPVSYPGYTYLSSITIWSTTTKKYFQGLLREVVLTRAVLEINFQPSTLCLLISGETER